MTTLATRMLRLVPALRIPVPVQRDWDEEGRFRATRAAIHRNLRQRAAAGERDAKLLLAAWCTDEEAGVAVFRPYDKAEIVTEIPSDYDEMRITREI